MRRLLFLLPLLPLLLGCGDLTGPVVTVPSFYSTRPTGKLLGFFAWPFEKWGTTPITTHVELTTPKYLPGRLQQARKQNFPIFFGFPRKMVSRDGTNKSPFSLANAKKAVDTYAAGPLKPDSVRKYAPWLVAWYLIDEPFCAHCWGGTAASYGDLVAYAKYFRQKIDPDHLVPMAIRSKPSQLAKYGTWDGSIDAGWTVWSKVLLARRIPISPKALMDSEYAVAKKYGWAMVGGINVEDCSGNGTAPCTPDDLKRYMPDIITHPGVCASASWKWADVTWSKSAIRDAWTYLANIAQAQPAQRCQL